MGRLLMRCDGSTSVMAPRSRTAKRASATAKSMSWSGTRADGLSRSGLSVQKSVIQRFHARLIAAARAGSRPSMLIAWVAHVRNRMPTSMPSTSMASRTSFVGVPRRTRSQPGARRRSDQAGWTRVGGTMREIRPSRYLRLATAVLLALLVVPSAGVRGASHREAPLIALDPAADNTDVYAFRSWVDPSKVVFIMNVIPGQDPGDGPNYFNFDDNVLYRIHIDNNMDGVAEDIVYEIRFTTETRPALG